MAAIGRDGCSERAEPGVNYVLRARNSRPDSVRAMKFVEHFLPDEAGGAGEESGIVPSEYRKSQIWSAFMV